MDRSSRWPWSRTARPLSRRQIAVFSGFLWVAGCSTDKAKPGETPFDQDASSATAQDASLSPDDDAASPDPEFDPPGPDAQVPDAQVPDDGASDAGQDAGPDQPSPRRPRPIPEGQVPGPITGSQPPFAIKPFDPAEHGYVQEEFFLAGWATQYKAEGEQGLNGKWKALADGTAPYKTRLLVRRPAAAKDFNGTVFVEWLNTTGQLDAEIGFGLAFEELMRGGYGYVGVSVQQSGVDALKAADGERYGTLLHPGDTYCYDIFAQAGAAVGWPEGVDPMGGLKVERVLAYGESQSAMRMITHVNAIQPLTHVYDGVIIHSRAGWGAPIGSEGNGLLGNGMPVRVREDSDTLVLQFFTESELFLSLGPAFAARQADSQRLRTWEVAGAAHADQHLLGDGADIGCGLVNDGPQHFVLKAALRAMHLWMKDGVAPPRGKPISVTADKKAIARDAHGNALGGIRTPAVDVPTATLSGEAPAHLAWNPMCMLFGQTIPFTPEKLKTLYPTHDAYVKKVQQQAKAAREAGFILPEEEATLVEEAQASMVPP
jgi:hypothetical protein